MPQFSKRQDHTDILSHLVLFQQFSLIIKWPDHYCLKLPNMNIYAQYVNWNLFPYCCFYQTLASKYAPKQIYFVKKIKSGDLNPRSLNLLQFHCLFTVIFHFGYCLRQSPCSTITKFRLRFNQYKSNIKLYGEGRRNFK